MLTARYSASAGLLFSTALIYALTFVIVKEAAAAVDPLVFVALRFTVAALVLLPFARLHGQTSADWRISMAAGALFGMGFVFQIGALARIDAGRTGFITGLYVVATPLLGMVLLRYRLTRRMLLSIATAVCGLFLLSYAPGGNLLGDALALAAALTFAGHVLIVECCASGLNWRFTVFVQCVTAAAGASALSLLSGSALLPSDAASWSAIVFLGAAATAITLPFQVIAQRSVSSSTTAFLFALEAPFAALFGVILRQESLSPLAVLGCGLMFAATLIAALQPNRVVSPV